MRQYYYGSTRKRSYANSSTIATHARMCGILKSNNDSVSAVHSVYCLFKYARTQVTPIPFIFKYIQKLIVELRSKYSCHD